jgi:hypothetical protein
LAALTDEWGAAVAELEQMLTAGDGPVRLDEAGDLVISPLTAEDIPTEAIELKAELTEMLPLITESCQIPKIRPSALFENRPPIHDRKGDLSAGMGADQVSPC